LATVLPWTSPGRQWRRDDGRRCADPGFTVLFRIRPEIPCKFIKQDRRRAPVLASNLAKQLSRRNIDGHHGVRHQSSVTSSAREFPVRSRREKRKPPTVVSHRSIRCGARTRERGRYAVLAREGYKATGKSKQPATHAHPAGIVFERLGGQVRRSMDWVAQSQRAPREPGFDCVVTAGCAEAAHQAKLLERSSSSLRCIAVAWLRIVSRGPCHQRKTGSFLSIRATLPARA